VQILIESFAGLVVKDVADPADALKLVWDEAWDLLILDLNLAGRSGLEVLGEVRKIRAKLPVLIMTMYPEDQFAVRAIKDGADGYLIKSSSPDVIAEAVRKILSGGKYISPTLAERLANEAARTGPQLLHEALSDRELDTVRMIASGQSVGQIAEKWCLSVKTISTYRARALDKLGLANNAAIMLYAIRHGLVELDISNVDPGDKTLQ
jgi:DNA-binding NarL/FixJ family response regulator